jgi:arylsulfatase A-like enzyme
MARRVIGWALIGAAAGLAAFAVETLLILRGEVAGLEVDLQGPVAAFLRAARPLLWSLVGRIAAVYALAGAGAGVLAGAMARMVTLPGEAPSRRERALAFTLELGAIGFVLAWSSAIARPALVDDLPGVAGPLEWLVNAGEPWHPAAFVGAWLLVHLVTFARARGARRAAAVAGALAVALGAWWRPPAGADAARVDPERSPPLVVLIGLDAFRPDRLGAFGGSGQVAPHLEAFIREATLFTRAYTPIAQTEPAWRTLLTARWPHRTGVRHPLTPDEQVAPLPTFTGVLAERGHVTSFRTDCSRFHFQPEASGWTERAQPPRGALNFLLEKLRYRAVGMVAANRLGAAWLPELVDNRALAGMYDSRGFARRLAEDWVRKARSGRPALLAYHATAAHFPGDPVYPHYRRFVSRTEPLSRRLRMVYQPLGQAPHAAAWSRQAAEGLYDELLSQADEQLGIILGALRRAGHYDRALVVVFSDHGESFHADVPGLAGATPVHGARLSDEENHVLLAIKLPAGMRGPPRVDELVRLIDIGPTVLEHAGAPALEGADGVSLWPLLRGEPHPPLYLYAETGFTHASPEVFDPGHLRGFPRTFQAYQVREDGAVVMSAPAQEAALREKDVGAFDGRVWLVRSPRQDHSIQERCSGGGECAELKAWLGQVAGER